MLDALDEHHRRVVIDVVDASGLSGQRAELPQPFRRDLATPLRVVAGSLADMTDAAVPNDPVVVLIEDEPMMTFDEWLALLDGDEPTDVDANAAEIVREFREHGEH